MKNEVQGEWAVFMQLGGRAYAPGLVVKARNRDDCARPAGRATQRAECGGGCLTLFGPRYLKRHVGSIDLDTRLMGSLAARLKLPSPPQPGLDHCAAPHLLSFVHDSKQVRNILPLFVALLPP